MDKTKQQGFVGSGANQGDTRSQSSQAGSGINHYGLTKTDLLEHIRTSNWDRFAVVGYDGSSPRILSSERDESQVSDLLRQGMPSLQRETT